MFSKLSATVISMLFALYAVEKIAPMCTCSIWRYCITFDSKTNVLNHLHVQKSMDAYVSIVAKVENALLTYKLAF